MALDSAEAVFQFIWSTPGPDPDRTYLSLRGYAKYMNECGEALNEVLNTKAEHGSADARRLFLSLHVMNGHCVELCRALNTSAQEEADIQFRDIGHENVQKRLENGLYRKNAHDVRVADRRRSSGLARVKDELCRRSKESNFPDKMADIANEYRQNANAVLDEFVCTMANIQEEYNKSRARQLVHHEKKRKLWGAHYRLFLAGAYVSGIDIPENYVGRLLTVMGDELLQVIVGTYVHVENNNVFCREHVINGIVNDNNILENSGICMIGQLHTSGSRLCPNAFSAIVSGKENKSLRGWSEESVDNNHHELIYDIIVIGSSGVLQYDQWDVLYSPVKEYVIRDYVGDSSNNSKGKDGNVDDDKTKSNEGENDDVKMI